MGTKNTLISLFGKSPLRPIQEHMKVAASASSQLPIIYVRWDQSFSRGYSHYPRERVFLFYSSLFLEEYLAKIHVLKSNT